MPNLLKLDWSRCRDGYVIKEIKGDSQSELYIVPASENFDSVDPLHDNAGLFLEFAHLEMDERQVLDFAGRNGLLSFDPVSDDIFMHWFFYIREMRVLVDLWRGVESEPLANIVERMVVSDEIWRAKISGEVAEFESEDRYNGSNLDLYKEVNRYLAPEHGPAPLRLEVQEVPGASNPSIHILVEDLWAALWIQFALSVTGGSQFRRCAVCPSWFVFGTGTGRRKSAHYCSDKCRKAAHRERVQGNSK